MEKRAVYASIAKSSLLPQNNQIPVTVLKGYREFFERADDPALCTSKEKTAFSSFSALLKHGKRKNAKKRISRQRNSYVMSTKKTDSLDIHNVFYSQFYILTDT